MQEMAICSTSKTAAKRDCVITAFCRGAGRVCPCPNSWFCLPKFLISINISEHWKAVNFPSSHSQFIASGGNKHHTFSTSDLPWAEQDLFYLDHTLCGVFIKQSTLKQSSAQGGLSWAIHWTLFGELVNISEMWKWQKMLVKRMENGVGKLGQSGQEPGSAGKLWILLEIVGQHLPSIPRHTMGRSWGSTLSYRHLEWHFLSDCTKQRSHISKFIEYFIRSIRSMI